MAVFSIVSSFHWLLLARSLQGVASACVAVCGMGMIARMYEENEEERSKFMGYILGGIAAGVLIGYPLGGFLFQFVGEAAPFIIISVCSLVLLCKYLQTDACYVTNHALNKISHQYNVPP